MNLHLFAGFLLITVVLLLTPRPIVTLMISTGATRGVRAGLVTVAGTSHWQRRAAGGDRARPSACCWDTPSTCSSCCAGLAPRTCFLVALSNPKTLAFFTAFLPQFVDPTRPAARQLAVMCALTVLLAGFERLLLGDRIRLWKGVVHSSGARARLLGRASGLTLIGGGIWLSLARRPA